MKKLSFLAVTLLVGLTACSFQKPAQPEAASAGTTDAAPQGEMAVQPNAPAEAAPPAAEAGTEEAK